MLYKYDSHNSFTNNEQDIDTQDENVIWDESHVHYNYPFHNYEYVDLGLPSGTLWAKCNLGAKTETDLGLYYIFANTKGFKDIINIDDKYYDSNNSEFTKYNETDEKIILDLEDDAASVNMKGGWHLPTVSQCQELISSAYTDIEHVTNYNNTGIKGTIITSKINGNTLFFPDTGYLLSNMGDLPDGYTLNDTGFTAILSNEVNDQSYDDGESVYAPYTTMKGLSLGINPRTSELMTNIFTESRRGGCTVRGVVGIMIFFIIFEVFKYIL